MILLRYLKVEESRRQQAPAMNDGLVKRAVATQIGKVTEVVLFAARVEAMVRFGNCCVTLSTFAGSSSRLAVLEDCWL